jgi:hypothetical protein
VKLKLIVRHFVVVVYRSPQQVSLCSSAYYAA